MNAQVRRGIDGQGLDAAVEADERLASEAILKARLIQDQERPDEAAPRVRPCRRSRTAPGRGV
jgi:hypothetical protein